MRKMLFRSEPAVTSGHMAYVPALDGVRAISILLVILTHTAPLGPKSWQLNSTAGPMGMSLFFCLSGFLIISMIHRNPNVRSFLIRRVLRIVPSVFLYMAIIALLFDISWQGIVSNLLFVSNYWHIGLDKSVAPTSHLWSLSVEMQFYLAIALLTLFLGRRSVWLVPPAALFITWLRIDAGSYINIQTHLRVDEILAGGTLALVALYWGDSIRTRLKNPALVWSLLGLVTGAWIIACHPAGGAMNYLRPYLAASLVGLVMFSRLRGLHFILESRPAAYIARISYALYIYHPLMIFGWMNAGSTLERYLLKRPISYLLTWMAAHASTFWWEARWQALAKRWTSPPSN